LRILLAALGVVVLLASGADAQTKPKEPRSEVKGYIPVQLRSFTIPTMAGDGRMGRGPITMFLVVRGEANVTVLCRYLPRIREAITLTVDQSPVPVTGEKYQLDEIGGRLHRAINRALPAPLVIRLHLVPTVRQLGEGGRVLDLPGTDDQCMSIEELPRDVTAMLSGTDAIAKTFVVAEPETRAAGDAGAAASRPVRARPRKPVPNGGPAIVVQMLESGRAAERGGPCRNLGDVWTGSFHSVSEARYWLERAFTLDDNNDGAVDDVGFILKADGKPDLSIYYFPRPGRQSVITVPTLRLGDDRIILGLCAGRADFKKPDAAITEAPVVKPPDLAAELAARNTEPAAPEENGLLDGPGLVFAIAMGAGLLLILGGGIGIAVARRRADRRRAERRKMKERRSGQRRRRDDPVDGPDRRTSEERREDPERRKEATRRSPDDRREADA